MRWISSLGPGGVFPEDCGLILAGLRSLPSDRHPGLRLKTGSERTHSRQGRGKDARFSITEAGRPRVANDRVRSNGISRGRQMAGDQL